MEAAAAAVMANQAPVVEALGAVGHWELDGADSQVAFSVKKFWGLVTVRGTFGELAGSADVADGGSVSGRLAIRAASVDTGQVKRDEHLRGADFFDVAQFPDLVVRIDRVELAGVDHGTARGYATVRGETRPVSFDLAIDLGEDGASAHVSGELTIDRSGFGMTWSPLRMAAMDVVVSVRLAFRRQAA